MDPQRERVQADLRGLLSGEAHCGDAFVQMYATDGSIYEVPPLGVIRPRGLQDVRAAVRYAAENLIPLHARGAGTGLAGESLGPGLVMDFSHSMRRIVDLDNDEGTVTIQPGVVLGQLNRYLAGFGRQFGPDPATGGVTTLGGVLGVDSSGSNWLRYGSARDQVVSLQLVLADGETFEAGKHRVTDDPNVDPHPRRRELVRRLADLIQREESIIAANRPASLVNRCGFHLWDVLQDGVLDLARLVVGSEGTLALIAQATVRTVPIPKHRGLVLMFFDRLESAVQAAMEARELGVTACDLMDRRILTLARDIDPRYAQSIPREAEAMLMVEQQGEESGVVLESLQEVAARWQRRRRLAFDFHLAISPDEFDLFRRLARRVSPTLHRVQGHERPVPFVEDFAVPTTAMADFVPRVQRVLQTRQATASVFAHAGHGQFHIRPFMDVTNPQHQRRMQDLANDLYAEVLAVNGTISGEHGCGLSRTWAVRKQYGPLYDVFREVKRIFDPGNLLNPGKIVADVPQPLIKNLRPVGNSVSEAGSVDDADAEPSADTLASNGQAAKPLELQLIWKGTIGAEAEQCNGCGRCRTQSPETRMCPIFRSAPAEEASPRAKANLMRAVINGQLPPNQLATEELKSIADLCVNCHQCRTECPAGVDIPKLMMEAKAQFVSSNGVDATGWVITRIDTIAAWMSRLASLSNWSLRQPWIRWLLEKSVGIAQGRKLPQVATSSFLRRAERQRLTRPSRRAGNKVLYFVDVYANWFDTQLADAFVQVLQHNNVSVYVHPAQRASGMAKISQGDAERARAVAEKNVAVLADAVRQGYTIVTTEPSAALCLTHEYLNLLDDDDARLVAANTVEACTYLWRMNEVGRLELDLKPLNYTVGYHMPCHLRALNVGSPGESLLGLIPGLTVRRIERGCSGMAGTYGLKRENYRSSLRAGWGLISAVRDPAIEVGTTECSSCKMQMEQGGGKPTVHPLKILALAYGLMPEVESLMRSRTRELVVT